MTDTLRHSSVEELQALLVAQVEQERVEVERLRSERGRARKAQAGDEAGEGSGNGDGTGGEPTGDAGGNGGDGGRPEPVFDREELRQALDDGERGDAMLFRKLYAGTFVFLKNGFDKGDVSGRWLSFQGHRWVDDIGEDAQVAIMNLSRHYEAEAAKRYAEIKELATSSKLGKTEIKELKANGPNLFKARARALQGPARVRSVLRVARWGSDEGLMIRDEDMDQQPSLLPVANGVLDLETGRLHSGRPEQFLSRGSPVDFLGLHVEAPTWEDTLTKVSCGREEWRDYFDRFVGYIATGLRFSKDFFVAYGPKSFNGKSIVLESLAEVMGDLAGSINVRALLEDRNRGTGPDPELLKLKGRRMITASEAPKGAFFSVDRIKMITGGDAISIRGLYADPVEIVNCSKLILHTNHIPKTRGSDPGFHNRMKILPFDAEFVAADKADPAQHRYARINDNEMTRRIQAERPGILAYIARCARRFLRDPDLTPPELVSMATSEVRADQDLVGEWLAQSCESAPGHKEQSAELYHAFAYWALRLRDMDPADVPTLRFWGDDMTTRFAKERGQHVFYKDIRLLDEFRCPADELESVREELKKRKR